MKILSALVILLSLGQSAMAFEKQTEACLAIANRSETTKVALDVYLGCLNSKKSVRTLESCAYHSAGLKHSGDPLLQDLGTINSTSFLICINH